MSNRKPAAAGALAGMAGAIGLMMMVGQGTQWPAYTVIFTDTDDLQQKWDEGQFATVPGGSEGQVQVNAAGGFGAVASGTAGQVLTSAGAGQLPSFQDAIGNPSCALQISGLCVLRLNEPIDTDGNGNPDLINLWKDYNDDGLINSEDLNSAYATLTAGGDCNEAIPCRLYVVAGEFDPPASFSEALPGDPKQDYNTHIVSPSYMTTQCASHDVVFRGAEYGVHPNDDLAFAVFGGDNAGNLGNVGMHLIGCAIDGGMPQCPAGTAPTATCYDSTASGIPVAAAKTGYRASSCTDCNVLDVEARNTWHTGIYTKNHRDSLIRFNYAHDCGGYRDVALGGNQPGIYHYTSNDPNTANDSAYNVKTLDNIVERCSHGITHRRQDDVVPRFRDMVVARNLVQHVQSTVFTGGGSEGTYVEQNHFMGGRFVLSTAPKTGGGCEPACGFSHPESSRNFRAINNVIRESRTPYTRFDSFGVELGTHHINAHFLGNTIEGAGTDGFAIGDNTPGLRISGKISDVGGAAIIGSSGPIADVVISDLDIGPSGSHAINGQFGIRDTTISNVRAYGSQRTFIRTSGNTVFSRNRIVSVLVDAAQEGFVGDGYRIDGVGWPAPPECNVAADSTWLVVQDATTNTDSAIGGGSIRNRLECGLVADFVCDTGPDDGTPCERTGDCVNGSCLADTVPRGRYVDWVHPDPDAMTIRWCATCDIDGGGNKANFWDDVILLNYTKNHTCGLQRHGLYYWTGNWTDDTFDGIRFDSSGPAVGNCGLQNALYHPNGNATNITANMITCAGIEGTCDAFDRTSTTAAGLQVLDSYLASNTTPTPTTTTQFTPVQGTFVVSAETTGEWTQTGSSSEFCYAGPGGRHVAGVVTIAGTRTTGAGGATVGAFAVGYSPDGPGVGDGDEVEPWVFEWRRDERVQQTGAFVSNVIQDGTCLALLVATDVGDTVVVEDAAWVLHSID